MWKVVFTYVHNISEWTLKTLQSNLAQYIISPPRHGSEGTMPWNALPADEVEEVKMFIRNYVTVNGLPQPTAPGGHNKQAPTYLPCVTTKKQVHAEYSKAGGKVAYNMFAKLWSKECRDIVIMLPKEDVCRTCADLQALISRLRTVETRLKHTEALKAHINMATQARDFYCQCIEDAKQSRADCTPDQTPQYQHITFDFAQQACIPHHARKVGALYFKVPWRIQIFGVAEEAIPKQINFLVDENETIGPDGSKSHDPNSVLSMLHYYLSHNSPGKPNRGLSCNNCCGQNKNRTVIAYLSWRTIVGQKDAIDLMFMRVGRTHCFVDGGFGSKNIGSPMLTLSASLLKQSTGLHSTHHSYFHGSGISGMNTWLRASFRCVT